MAKISKLVETKGNINCIKTNKYKDINVVIRCSFKYDRRFKAALYILAGMMNDTCEKYDTKLSFEKAKDMLYGLGFACIPSSYSDVLNYSITYNFTNPKFINGFEEKDCIDFIDETINHPNLSESSFVENVRIFKAALLRKLDNPSMLASSNLVKEIAKDDKRFDIYDDDIDKDLEFLTLDDVKYAFSKLFESRVDIFLVGDYSKDLEDYLKKYESKVDLHATCMPLDLNNIREVETKKDVGQSTLLVTYKTPYVRSSKEYYAFTLGNVIFGGIPSSLLFQEVREKNSLCYSIFSRTYRCEGIMIVLTNIDSKNKAKTLEEIRKQYQRMVDKEYDPSLIEVAKLMLINNSLTIDDDLDYLIDYTYRQRLLGINNTMDEFIDNINKVTIDDISNVFKNFEEYIVYFLEGTRHE